jgi:hypothetical protein
VNRDCDSVPSPEHGPTTEWWRNAKEDDLGRCDVGNGDERGRLRPAIACDERNGCQRVRSGLHNGFRLVRECHFGDSRFDGNLQARPVEVMQCPFDNAVIVSIEVDQNRVVNGVRDYANDGSTHGCLNGVPASNLAFGESLT